MLGDWDEEDEDPNWNEPEEEMDDWF